MLVPSTQNFPSSLSTIVKSRMQTRMRTITASKVDKFNTIIKMSVTPKNHQVYYTIRLLTFKNTQYMGKLNNKEIFRMI